MLDTGYGTFKEHALCLRQEFGLRWKGYFPAIGMDDHLPARGKFRRRQELVFPLLSRYGTLVTPAML
jgi:hypothetical protein